MTAALLAALVLYSLFAGRLPAFWLGIVCLLSGGILFLLGHHRHDGILVMDLYARRSRLCRENAAFKMAAGGGLLILSICTASPWPPLVLFGFLSAVTVIGGKLEWKSYISLLSLPIIFLLLSSLTLLWDFCQQLPADAAAVLPFPGGWLAVLPESQQRAGLVLARALGAVSCLYFISLSTPMPELLTVLRRIHLPEVMIELMVLIYRYIFILLTTCRQMQEAAASRLGYGRLKNSLRTTGLIYGGLLGHSFQRAGACFDAMESRCYTGQMVFLTRSKPLSVGFALLLVLPFVGMLIWILLTL